MGIVVSSVLLMVVVPSNPAANAETNQYLNKACCSVQPVNDLVEAQLGSLLWDLGLSYRPDGLGQAKKVCRNLCHKLMSLS